MKVLFVCLGNIMRSQMAEGFYNAFTDSRDATSAGTRAELGEVPHGVQEVMKEKGISLTGHKSEQLTQQMVERSDKVVYMTQNHLPSYVAQSEKAEYWPVGDPWGGSYGTLRDTRDDIEQRVRRLIKENEQRHG